MTACIDAATASAQDAERDATRIEVGERFCRHHASCLAAVKREVARGMPIQSVILSMGDGIFAENPANAEAAYEVVTRALVFTHDFLSDAELRAAQPPIPGTAPVQLRASFAWVAQVCGEVRFNWLGRYLCVMHRLRSYIPAEDR